VATADFDAYADTYRRAVEDSIAFSNVEHDFFSRRKARAILDLARRRLGDPGTLRMLDVGCGVGSTDRFLAGEVGALSGVDTSAEAVSRAASNVPAVDYRSYDGGRIPFDDASMDLTFAICVFHHVPPEERGHLAAEMRRVLRRGGLAVVFEHNPLNPLTRLAVSRCEFDEDAILLTRGESARLLEDAGLRPLERRYMIFFIFDRPRSARFEEALGWLPAGAQHYVAGAK
jgi:SAM-dependent methyltransferase